jgi:8-oxo-dGTP pyrophosphatase MutT (NUDIX family)
MNFAFECEFPLNIPQFPFPRVVVNAELFIDEPDVNGVDLASTMEQIAFMLARVPLPPSLAAICHALARLLMAPALPGLHFVSGKVLSRVSRVILDARATSSSDSCTHFLRTNLTDPGFEYKKEINAWGTVDIVYETTEAGELWQDTGLYMLNIAPGKEIPMHWHPIMRECESIIHPGLESQSEPLVASSIRSWGYNAHYYLNKSALWATVLCCDTPHFTPNLEVPCCYTPHAEPQSIVLDYANPDNPAHSSRADLSWNYVQPEMPTIWLPTFLDGKLSPPRAWLDFPGGLGADDRVKLTFDPSKFMTPDAVLVFVLAPALALSSLCSASNDLGCVLTHATPTRIYGSPHTPGQFSVLLVKHRRGWELPGGKVEPGEAPAIAARREVEEEAGLHLNAGALRPLAQYTIHSHSLGQKAHVKTVFVTLLNDCADLGWGGTLTKTGTVHNVENFLDSELRHETTKRLLWPSNWPLHVLVEDDIEVGTLIHSSLHEQPPEDSDTNYWNTPPRVSPLLLDNVFPACLKAALAWAFSQRIVPTN